METKHQIKKFYIEDIMGVDEICTALDITRGTFYYHKNYDKKNGINWDELRLSNQQSKKDLVEKENEFISTLIAGFEENMAKLKEESPENAIGIIAKYISTYQKIKHPVNKSCKQEKINAGKEAIAITSTIALEQNEKSINDFLDKNLELIISKISKIT